MRVADLGQESEMKRRTLKKLRADHHHNVYVLFLVVTVSRLRTVRAAIRIATSISPASTSA
jgi:hypothetical protein